MIPEKPIVIVRNNTGADVPVKLFPYAGSPTSINANTHYQWDITSENFLAATQVSIQVRTSASASFTTYTAPLDPANAQGVVNALNSLNLGTSWYTVTSGGNTYISTDNDTLIFGDLTISDPNPINLNIENIILLAGSVTRITANSFELILTFSPVNLLLTVPIMAGVVITINVTAGPLEPLHVNVLKGVEVLLPQVTVLPGDSFSYQFTIESDADSYTIGVDSF